VHPGLSVCEPPRSFPEGDACRQPLTQWLWGSLCRGIQPRQRVLSLGKRPEESGWYCTRPGAVALFTPASALCVIVFIAAKPRER
jgi:hypothetical protein